jgi:hypothetical protein
MKNGINAMGLILKIPLITNHEKQMRIDDTIPNDHDQSSPFLLYK